MKAVYNILNNQDKVTKKHFYHIRCHPDLGEGFCAILCVPCTCYGCVEQLYNTWFPNLDKTLQPCYVILTNMCMYSSVLSVYINSISTNWLRQKEEKTRREGY